MFFRCHIFVQIARFLLLPVVGMFSCYSLPIVDRILLCCFGKCCFVRIFLPFVVISLIFLLSPALFSLFPQVVRLFFPVLPVPVSRLFQHLSFFIILACFRSFLFVFPVEFPIPGLTVSLNFLMRSQFSHKLILHLLRLVHLTRLYYLSVCKVVCDLFYPFLSEEFSILCFLMKVE